MDHDQVFKELLRAFLDELVTIVAPRIAAKLVWEKRQFLDKEIFTDIPGGEHRRLDIVAKVPAKQGPSELILVHVEIEGAARKSIAQRMWRYYMQLQLRHNLPVLPIVLFGQGGEPDVSWGSYQEILFGAEILRFSFLRFGLSGASPEAYLARPEALCAALASRMKRTHMSRPRRKVECLKKIARADLDEARRFLLLNFVQTYLPLTSKEAKEYYTLLEEDPAKEAKSMQLTWADQIKEKGRVEGLAKGRAEGKAEALLFVLEQRKIAVDEEARKKILACTKPSTLEKWLARALTALSIEEVFAPRKKPSRKKTPQK